MPSLKLLAWIAYGLAALCALAGLGTEDILFVVPAVAAAISGVLFTALEKIIEALHAIRDALQPGIAAPSEDTNGQVDRAPTKSLEELKGDIDRLKAKASAG
ncbi:hypothetical protein DDZ14_16295 [Maritimibacter sp. 55A14]|uniref:hypothetical protein n=1 Tax=Maritimibacter sp. 55A14 TaxID=2174844 RepID=UPI000D607DB6|nr:hypothetical protein [Maritimibacter sp. 55A14]PWE30000.1 hypothetical protein DDZ14_16295 [Maritimibacter sp. 55A14]